MTAMTARVENSPKPNSPEIHKVIVNVAYISSVVRNELIRCLKGPLGISDNNDIYINPNKEGVDICIHNVSEEDFIRILKMRPAEELVNNTTLYKGDDYKGYWAAADIVTKKDEIGIMTFKPQKNRVTIFSENYKENTPEWKRLEKAVKEIQEEVELVLEREVSHVC